MKHVHLIGASIILEMGIGITFFLGATLLMSGMLSGSILSLAILYDKINVQFLFLV